MPTIPKNFSIDCQEIKLLMAGVKDRVEVPCSDYKGAKTFSIRLHKFRLHAIQTYPEIQKKVDAEVKISGSVEEGYKVLIQPRMYDILSMNPGLKEMLDNMDISKEVDIEALEKKKEESEEIKDIEINGSDDAIRKILRYGLNG